MSKSRPKHYAASDIQPIDVIESWDLGFHLGNVIKYIGRAQHKGSEIDDIDKAIWYLKRYRKGLSDEAI